MEDVKQPSAAEIDQRIKERISVDGLENYDGEMQFTLQSLDKVSGKEDSGRGICTYAHSEYVLYLRRLFGKACKTNVERTQWIPQCLFMEKD